jgi:uncharacterized phiE125 gp8 family phage protein
MVASIRYIKGLGNAALYVRARDASARFWNWTTRAWVAVEDAGCRVFLAEYADASTIESLYQAGIDAPPGEVLIEYVRSSDSRVLGEEEAVNGIATDVASATLATLADLRTYLGKSAADTADDVLLARILAAVSAWFERQTGRKLALAAYTEILDGDGQAVIVPREYPVTEVTAVTVGTFEVPQATASTSSGWFLRDGVIRLRGYTASHGVGNVSIAYTAGFEFVPDDIQQAVRELAALKYRERPHVGTASQSVAGQSMSYLPSIIPASVQSVVDSYKRPVF